MSSRLGKSPNSFGRSPSKRMGWQHNRSDLGKCLISLVELTRVWEAGSPCALQGALDSGTAVFPAWLA